MKIWNIILKYDESEHFSMNFPEGEECLVIPTKRKSVVSTNVFEILKEKKLYPVINSQDLLNISIGVYTADQLVSRSKYGYQGWSRHFKFYIPVNVLTDWESVKRELEQLLSFLSGDKWEIYFRSYNQKGKTIQKKIDNKAKINTASLFSGGLDSFIGALDLLEAKKRVVFISHYKRGSESKVQTELINVLTKAYGKDSFENFKFYVQPGHKGGSVGKEESSRARSFLFMCLGLSVANAFNETVNFIIPENGLISLNIPLTNTRVGSHSTRTTHPYYLKLFKNIAKKLGIKNKISNPYQFLTKGEMMLACKNQKILKSDHGKTVSCSHPDNSRYHGKSPGEHCGYCTPCIIRQAAENKSKNKGTTYTINIKKNPPSPKSQSGMDLRAFKLAIERLKRKKKNQLFFEILKAGPLPFVDKADLDKYISIYQRGMTEVADLFV